MITQLEWTGLSPEAIAAEIEIPSGPPDRVRLLVECVAHQLKAQTMYRYILDSGWPPTTEMMESDE